MEYRILGRTGVRVSALGLGTYNFGHVTSAAESRKIFDIALEAGCNLVDTANSYGHGASEACLGDLIGSVRDDIVLCTKVFNRVGPLPNDWGNSALALIRECERSLQRLKTDHIDIYFLHRHDPHTPIDEAVGALTRLVESGKIRYFGFSTFPTSEALAEEQTGVVRSWRVVEAIGLASQRGMAHLACEQLPYNLLEREVERHLLPVCRECNVGVLGYSPLAMGALTAHSAGAHGEVRFDKWFSSEAPEWAATNDARQALVGVARRCGMSLEALAIAWSARPEVVSSVLLGPRTAQHMREALRAPARLADDVLAEIDRVVPPGTSLWMRPSEAVYRRRNASREIVESSIDAAHSAAD